MEVPMRTRASILFVVLFLCGAARSPAQEEVQATTAEASKLTKEDIPDLRQRAESGDSKAQLLLGKAYALQFGVKHNYKEAMKWYLKSAEQGNRVAQYHVCNNYQFGHGVRKDADTAVDWCRRAADQGLPEAQERLAVLFGLKKNYFEAAVWRRKAADQGFFLAQTNLAHDCWLGQGVPQDDTTAYMWLLLALAAQCGEPPQRCVEKDPEARAFAEEGRAKVGAKLSPEQVAEARRRASEWLIARQKEPLPAEGTEAKVADFLVAHEHGGAMFIPGGSHGLDYCFGWMTIGSGTIKYADRKGRHAFEIPIAQIKQVKPVIRAMGGAPGVEILLENGKKYSFYPIDDQIEPQDRQPLLDALDRELGRK
jgi:TPR repeat protein